MHSSIRKHTLIYINTHTHKYGHTYLHTYIYTQVHKHFKRTCAHNYARFHSYTKTENILFIQAYIDAFMRTHINNIHIYLHIYVHI